MTAFLFSYCLRLFFIVLFFVFYSIWTILFRYFLKYISIYFIWLYFIFLYFYYLFFLEFKLLITNNIFRFLWVFFIKLKNEFLVWLYLGWNYALVRSFVFWYPFMPHYYSPSTFSDYPLAYHPFFISFFNKLKPLNLDYFNLSIVFYYFSYLINCFFLLFSLLFSLIKSVKYISMTIFMNLYKYYYRIITLKFFKGNLLNNISLMKLVYFIIFFIILFFFKNIFLFFILLLNIYFFSKFIVSNLKLKGFSLLNYFFISFGFINYFLFRFFFSILRNIIRLILFVLFRINI